MDVYQKSLIISFTLRCSSFETLLFNVFQNAMPLKLWGQTHDFCVFLLKCDFSQCNWRAKQTRMYMSMFLFVEKLKSILSILNLKVEINTPCSVGNQKSILQASNSKSQNNSVASRLPTTFLGAQLYKYIPHIISREREMR